MWGHFLKTWYLCCTFAKYQQKTVKRLTRKIQNKTNDSKYLNRQLEMFSGSLVINALEKDLNST
jgi:hypothetical protein